MEAGKLYQIKEYFWLLYPTLEVASKGLAVNASFESYRTHARMESELWSQKFKCDVSFIEPQTMFVLLNNEAPLLKKILTTDGQLGWIVLDEYLVRDNVNFFEEVKT